MKPRNAHKGKKSYGRRNILDKKKKKQQHNKARDETADRGRKNAKFVQRVKKMEEDHLKQKLIEDKYRAESSSLLSNRFTESKRLIEDALKAATAEDGDDANCYASLLTALKSDNYAAKRSTEEALAEDSDSEFMSEEELEAAKENVRDAELDELEEGEEAQGDHDFDVLFTSDDEETENAARQPSAAIDDFVDTNQESDSESASESDEEKREEKPATDYFAKHLDYELKPEHVENLLATPSKNTKHSYKWPTIGTVHIEMPQGTSCQLTDSPAYLAPMQASELQRLGVNAALAKQTPLLSPYQSELFVLMNSYHDVFFPQRTHALSEDLRLVYCLHALNHLKKTRSRVLRHNAKLAAAAAAQQAARKSKQRVKQQKLDAIIPDSYRDQGFVRPKVLFLVPTRHAAYLIVKMLTKLCFGHEPQSKSLMNHERFLQAYTGDSLYFPKTKPKPEDYEQTFAGNTDDNFRLGLSLSKKYLKCFTDFYASDILIASPLALRTIIGAAGSAQREYDFLSSIELLIIDQAELLLAQNWENLLHVLDHLHLQPKTLERTADFQRVRSWYINGWARFYRQTLLFSSHQLPEFRALFNSKCANYNGKVIVLQPQDNDIRNVVVGVAQQFKRIDVSTLDRLADCRFEHFVSEVLPRFRQTNFAHCLIYVPSYFDYVRLRNYFRQEHISFVQICEYTKVAKIARARDIFYHSGAHFMLYSERAHFFRRTRIKGIRHLLMYQPPAYPHFYSELVNMMQPANQNPRDDLADCMSITVLYTQFDMLQLGNILGNEAAIRLVKSNQTEHTFQAE